MYPATQDSRALAIKNWLTEQLRLNIESFEPASNDASFRRYFRVIHTGGRHIIMDAPPDKENTEPFIRIAKLLRQSGLHVPAIFEQNSAQGFLLLEDLGSSCLLDRLDEYNAETLYRSALASLFKLQSRTDPKTSPLPEYDQALLQRELEIFYQWFIGDLLSLNKPTTLQHNINRLLINSAMEQPRVCVHRDYHSRNLMILEHDSPGVIDFQDAVIGPITYDLVSLLRDCYIRWPQASVERWMQAYYHRLVEAKLVTVGIDTFRRWFDLMGLQRHLKAIGIFARLHLRDHKSDYLADIPRTLDYVLQICRVYPELTELEQYLRHEVLPIYRDKI